nr:DUF4333 domain-containing protein [Actinomycetota bacterium]
PEYGQQGYGPPQSYQPTQSYAQPGYVQQGSYSGAGYAGSAPSYGQAATPYGQQYAQPGYPPEPARKKGKGLLISLAALVAVLVAAFLVLFLVVKPSWLRPLDLRHTAVEQTIEARFGVSNVVCNGGKNFRIGKGKTFSCVDGRGAKYTVTLTDDKGHYDPSQG